MRISELSAYNKNIELTFIIIKSLGQTRTKDNSIVYSYLVADATASVEYSIFDQSLNVGDIIRINYAYSTLFKGKLRVYNSDLTEIKRIDEFCMNFKAVPNMSEEVKH